LGKITNGQMSLNPIGEIAHTAWFKTESMRPNIRSHEFIVMPNHIHGIIEIIPAPIHVVGADCIRPPDMPQSDSSQSEQSGRVQRAPTDTTIDRYGQSEPVRSFLPLSPLIRCYACIPCGSLYGGGNCCCDPFIKYRGDNVFPIEFARTH
jgi:hypothetical protein